MRRLGYFAAVFVLGGMVATFAVVMAPVIKRVFGVGDALPVDFVRQ